jgi:hypothetical protein
MVQSELSFSAGEGPVFFITDTGIEIQPDLTYEQWAKGLQCFKFMQKRVKTAFSEYLDFGRLKYGKEKVDTALLQLEFEMPTINEAKYINNVPANIRQEGLTAEHLIVLGRSDINDKEKAKWAKTASREKLTPTQLKASIKEGEVVDVSVARAHTHGVITLHAVTQEFTIWFNRMGGTESITKLDRGSIEEIVEQLRPMYDLFYDLNNHLGGGNTEG